MILIKASSRAFQIGMLLVTEDNPKERRRPNEILHQTALIGRPFPLTNSSDARKGSVVFCPSPDPQTNWERRFASSRHLEKDGMRVQMLFLGRRK